MVSFSHTPAGGTAHYSITIFSKRRILFHIDKLSCEIDLEGTKGNDKNIFVYA